jgi:predicted nucleic acid-binding protein
VTTVFLDTVGLIALWDESDQWHQPAQRAYAKLKRTKLVGVTTEAVLLECGNAAARRPYRRDVSQLRERLSKKGRLIAILDDEWSQAWAAYDRSEAAGAGIVDQTSFVVMRRLGIHEAFTNDAHFTATGFQTLF